MPGGMQGKFHAKLIPGGPAPPSLSFRLISILFINTNEIEDPSKKSINNISSSIFSSSTPAENEDSSAFLDAHHQQNPSADQFLRICCESMKNTVNSRNLYEWHLPLSYDRRFMVLNYDINGVFEHVTAKWRPEAAQRLVLEADFSR
ncbi:hypothetical protein C5167_032648 [Papaver somniferum]|uniref:Uncharacterized protein n=1 Tax=Papaver somniferum TaxID=3469 RepID=A0A4Y7KB12_PAPSO|nr:hypothetical protein C5167_032648 [Papaver somniferum]